MQENTNHTQRKPAGGMQDTAKTTCCYCGVGCGIQVHRSNGGALSLEGDSNYPVNKGMLCSKGMNLHYTLMDSGDRLTYPEMRWNRQMPRQRVSWDEALDRTAAVFRSIIDRYGPDAVAFYASGQCLTEEYYVINKLVKGYLGTNNLDTNSRLCMSSAVTAYKMSLGEDSVPACYEDLEIADVIWVAGANPAWCHPILWRRVEAAKQRNPSLKIIVSDPRRTQSCSIADLHLQLNPGTDITLHHAVGRVLVENGDFDSGFILDHTEGFEKYKAAIMKRSVAEAAAICGLQESDIRKAASWIADAKGYVSMWTMGLNQSAIGTHKNLSLINLHLITGHIGRPGSGPLSLTGQPNAMGGREVGGMSNLLPAHRDLANPLHRKEVAEFWGVGQLPEKPGLTATQIFDGLNEGKVKAIWILCTNPLLSLPDARMAEAALKKAKFVVVQDISNKPETYAFADVVLPAAGWLEKEGTMTNAERRISYLQKFVDAPGEARPDAEIICAFARKMGFNGFDYQTPAQIFAEHAALTKGTRVDISGLDYEVLRQKRSVQWPYPEGTNTEGTQRLFTNKKFYTPSGRAILHSFDDGNTSEQPDEDYPLILTTGRLRDQWHTMSKTGKVNKLKQHVANSFIEIHPNDAAERGIENNQMVVVYNSRGQARVKAKLTEDIKPGVAFMPMHWGKIAGNDLNRANNLTHNRIDPISKEPDFKFSAVQVAAYAKPRQKIIVIGAGAGAFGFIKSYRALNADDEIVVFSKENYPFYNRVLLPDYISGAMPWEHLVKLKDEEEAGLDITLHRGVWVTNIDREAKSVTDNNGLVHSYDVLLVATGSRPAMLRDVPPINGIFTMRSRMDADKFRGHVKPEDGQVVIVGGGLLGIELAASLREVDVQVTIIQRISRLMDRQLDPLGSELLHEELVLRGIDIYYNDEVERYLGDDKITGIKLKSGLHINCQAVVIAVGTIPNVELARECGIACNRGVKVDTYLRTSDENIFAIGEIAEYEGFLYGITAAAEQQADIVARYLNGDIAATYQGSLLMNILKLHGTQLCSLGLAEIPNQEKGYEEIVFIDKARRYYKKCIVHNDKLVGAILIGDNAEFLEFRNLIEGKIELSERRLQLLRSNQKADPVIGKLVCSCGTVGEGNLRKKIEGGCKDLLQLCQLTGAGMGCGSCRPEVKALLEKELKAGLSSKLEGAVV